MLLFFMSPTLFDGLSKIATAHNARRSREGEVLQKGGMSFLSIENVGARSFSLA